MSRHQSISSSRSTEAAPSPGDGDGQILPTLTVYKYGPLQQSGEQRRRWIDDANDVSCRIQSSELTIRDLRTKYEIGEPTRNGLSDIVQNHLNELDIANKDDNNLEGHVYQNWEIDEVDLKWVGSVGESMIVIEDVEREWDSDAPYISEVTLALYRATFNLDDLRYIFVTTILNRETLDVIINQLYTETNGLEWPADRLSVDLSDSETWEHGTPEYDALLGTRIGRLVSYIVIGGFYRGSARIARISVWPSWVLGTRANMRFDIEPVSLFS